MTEHIKVPAVEPLVRYVANGSQTVFTYPFPIFASEDLKIYFDGALQVSGYDIADVGETSGGTVTFDTPPDSGIVITLERRLPFERLTDFLEGGDFSAAAINSELDYLTASIQQVDRDLSPMLRYGDHETPGETVLPSRVLRANKALGFDGNGDPVAVSLEGSMAPPDYMALGTGAVTRTSSDKFSDLVSVKDFGAAGDGLTDDTLAIQQALTAHDCVYIPPGSYFITGTITVGERQTLFGAGQTSVLVCQDNSFNAIEVPADYAGIYTLRIEKGDTGILLYGKDRPCVQTTVCDVTIFQANIGVKLDGYTDTNKPCYWNNFDRVLVVQPNTHGFHLTKSGAGDTPNANRFHTCRVYSLGTDITGAGFYVEHGAHNNAFVDCEANVKGTAQGCCIIGAGASKTILINLFTESDNGVTNVLLESGSSDTAIYNLHAASDGAAIWDQSGGEYTAYNAGYPYKNRFQKTTVTDMTATVQRYDPVYTDTTGPLDLDTVNSVHLLSSYSGAITANLPNASDAQGMMMFIKKIDISDNVITINETGGNGPDAKSYYLGAENDYVQMVSNGAEWFVISSNRAPGNTRFYEGTGTYQIDMAVDTYLVSSYFGAVTAQLPPADAPESVGRTITIKKTDPSSNTITVTEQGGTGPDNASHALSAQYNAITVVSNGAAWYIVSKYN